MMKRILIPLDSSPFTEAAVELGAMLAKRRGAEIAGLVVLDLPGIEKSMGPIPVGGLYYAERRIASEEKLAEAKIRKLLAQFKARCDQLGVAHVESEEQGTPSEWILRESRFFDCVIMGLRTYFRYHEDPGSDQVYGTKDDHAGNSLEQIMDHAAVPLIAVPLGWKPPPRDIRVFIAFDGSLPAVRALHGFADFFSGEAVDVTILVSDPEMERSRNLLNRAADYLRAHGFVGVKTEWTPVPIRDAMADTYAAQSDLIVLGAHSKSALRDFVLGSVCRDLIERATKPLLIAP